MDLDERYVDDEHRRGLLAASGILLLTACGMIVAPTVSRALKHVAREGATRIFLVYSDVQSKYRWKLRVKTPNWIRIPFDRFFGLNESASVDCPKNVTESVKVLSATLGTTNMNVDVTENMAVCLRKADQHNTFEELGSVVLYMHQFFDSAVDVQEWSLEVIYLGHADPSKRIPAQEFGVKYVAKALEGITFPPYKATEKIKKGFKANKVVHARTFHEKHLTPLARKYAGLRANFYQDVEQQSVQKLHIDHKEVHVLLSENGKSPTTVVAQRK